MITKIVNDIYNQVVLNKQSYFVKGLYKPDIFTVDIEYRLENEVLKQELFMGTDYLPKYLVNKVLDLKNNLTETEIKEKIKESLPTLDY